MQHVTLLQVIFRNIYVYTYIHAVKLVKRETMHLIESIKGYVLGFQGRKWKGEM